MFIGGSQEFSTGVAARPAGLELRAHAGQYRGMSELLLGLLLTVALSPLAYGETAFQTIVITFRARRSTCTLPVEKVFDFSLQRQVNRELGVR